MTLDFNLRLSCKYVSSITTTFRKMLPAAEYAHYLKRLITLFKSEKGPIFEIFAQNFAYLLGLGARTQNDSLQQKNTSASAFQKLLEIHSRILCR